MIRMVTPVNIISIDDAGTIIVDWPEFRHVLDRGTIWLTEEIAQAAAPYGWEIVPGKSAPDGLVAVRR